MNDDPLNRTEDDFAEILSRISLADSPVGIDAKLTHAIIIAYLRQISARLEGIESRLEAVEAAAKGS